MITLTLVAILGVLLAVVVMRLLKEPAAPVAAQPGAAQPGAAQPGAAQPAAAGQPAAAPTYGPVRVAIVGGGCAGVATAWQLAQQEGYDVHVYERSWRLGGKGSSVRDDNGCILEHGLHVWLGFYERQLERWCAGAG
jgi:NADPH-dependent 2,4-dienoyl-CoA reductase/sulfur reductase-like enzyme